MTCFKIFRRSSRMGSKNSKNSSNQSSSQSSQHDPIKKYNISDTVKQNLKQTNSDAMIDDSSTEKLTKSTSTRKLLHFIYREVVSFLYTRFLKSKIHTILTTFLFITAHQVYSLMMTIWKVMNSMRNHKRKIMENGV